MINEIKLILKAQKHYYKTFDYKITEKTKNKHLKAIREIINIFENSNHHGIVALLEYHQFRDAVFLLKSQNDPDYKYLYKLDA